MGFFPSLFTVQVKIILRVEGIVVEFEVFGCFLDADFLLFLLLVFPLGGEPYM